MKGSEPDRPHTTGIHPDVDRPEDLTRCPYCGVQLPRAGPGFEAHAARKPECARRYEDSVGLSGTVDG